MATSTVDTIYIYPTDTVWGIGSSIFSEIATSEIHRIKNSDEKKPMSVMFSTVDQFYSFVNLPINISSDFINSFFELETTLLIPVNLLIKDIPEWVLTGSELVGCRCINSSAITSVVNDANSPITTTSLNLSGESSIVSKDDALAFVSKYAPNAKVITCDGILSGKSSTLCSISEAGDFKILREGSKCEEVKKLCRLLSA